MVEAEQSIRRVRSRLEKGEGCSVAMNHNQPLFSRPGVVHLPGTRYHHRMTPRLCVGGQIPVFPARRSANFDFMVRKRDLVRG